MTESASQPPFFGVRAQAFGRAQQANLGRGVQINYYAGGAGSGKPETAPDTLVPPPNLVGRALELGRLRQARRQAQEAGRPVVVSTVHGMGGAGKTALVRALAAEIAEDFPDARIEVDLLGFTPGHEPRDPGEVLGELLTLVGFDPAHVPAHTQARAGLWRGWLARHRVLLVLDNARDAEQVRPLLPGTEAAKGCLVLVTSRDQLTDLNTAVRIGVDVLLPQDAVALRLRMAGRSQAEMRAGDEELAELAGLCGHLPLALRPVGSLLTVLSPAELVEVMRSAEHPLEHLDEADHATRAAFTVSYRALPRALQEALRACAWHPGPDFDADSVAALTGKPRPLVKVHLASLLQRNMLIGLPHGRYSFHDLFAGYARRHTGYSNDAPDVRRARRRLYQRLSTMVGTATVMLTEEAADQADDVFDAPTHAHTWLISATDELTTAAHTALKGNWPNATALAHKVAYWLMLDGKYEQAAGLYTTMHTTTSTAGDRLGQANALECLGDIARLRGEYGEAAEYHQRALRLYESTGNRHGQAHALQGLGHVAWFQGEYGEAAEYHRQALRLYESTGNRHGQAHALQGLGHAARLRGEYGEAAEYHRQALRLYESWTAPAILEARSSGSRLPR
ncbi:tetratricopeptide repeat protein, partial [Actinomadura keratinilytica]|uniref:tetratricopeptide repeat protein n=1 Tax=Actinomadura keratinilytica TaxID=547461 RepID=UPI0031E680E5